RSGLERTGHDRRRSWPSPASCQPSTDSRSTSSGRCHRWQSDTGHTIRSSAWSGGVGRRRRSRWPAATFCTGSRRSSTPSIRPSSTSSCRGSPRGLRRRPHRRKNWTVNVVLCTSTAHGNEGRRDMSAERQDQERKDVTEDLELSEDEAGGVKGGTIPIEGG